MLFATYFLKAGLSKSLLMPHWKPAKHAIPKVSTKKLELVRSKVFTGIDDPYEAPEKPEIRLDADNKSIDELAEEVVAWARFRWSAEKLTFIAIPWSTPIPRETALPMCT